MPLRRFKNFLPAPLTPTDAVVYGALLLFCFISFQHSDMVTTAAHSMAYTFGHVADFYEYNAARLPGNKYLPSVYILFGVWALPLRLLGLISEPTLALGGLVLWFKLLTAIFTALTAHAVYRIGRTLRLSEVDAKLMAALWLTSPVMIFSQFVFGQYDIFMVYLMVLGVWALLEEKTSLFILCFALATPFKYMALLVFVPLLLLKEKRPLRAIVAVAACFLPALLEAFVYRGSGAFRTDVYSGDALNILLKNTGDWGGESRTSFFLFGWILFSIACFLKDFVSEEEFREWVLYVPVAVTGLFFLFVPWRPQWLIIATPFLCMTTFLNRKAGVFCLIDALFFYFFIAITAAVWSMSVDQGLWRLGVWGGLNHALFDSRTGVAIWKLYPPDNHGFKVTAYMAFTAAHAIFKRPGGGSFSLTEFQPFGTYVGRARFRFLALAVFLVPAIYAYAVCLPVSARAEKNLGGPVVLKSGEELTQSFVAGKGRFKKIRISPEGLAPADLYGAFLHVELRESPGKTLLGVDVPWSRLPGGFVIDPSGDLPLIAGTKYEFGLRLGGSSHAAVVLTRLSPSDAVRNTVLAAGSVEFCRESDRPAARCAPVVSVLPGE